MTHSDPLGRLLALMAPSVDDLGAWQSIQERAHKRRGIRAIRSLLAVRGADQVLSPGLAGDLPRASAPKRHSGIRAPIIASIAVVLVVAVAVGSLLATRSLTRPDFVLAINDQTVMQPAAAGQTGATAGRWEWLPLTVDGGNVSSLTIDPNDPSVLYVGIDNGGYGQDDGLYKSEDGAGSWKRLPSISGQILVLLIDPAQSSTLYVLTRNPAAAGGSDHGIRFWRSDDAGSNWKNITPSAFVFHLWPPIVMIDGSSSPSALVAMGRDAFWRSSDRGESWTRLTLEESDKLDVGRPPLPPVAQQALDRFLPSFSGTITDAETGASVAVDPDDLYHKVSVDPREPSIFYAATREGVYKSTDGGKTWRKASRGLSSLAVSQLVPDPSSASILYAATSAGTFKTSDGGATWDMVLAGAGSVMLAPSAPATLYAWTSDGLFRSDDAGKKWTELAAAGLPPRPDMRLEREGLLLVAAGDPDTVFAVSTLNTDNGAGPFDLRRYLYRSTDGGRSWTQTLEYGGGLIADSGNPSTLYAADGDRRWSKSTDLGTTWTVVSGEEWVDPIVAVAQDPHPPAAINVVQTADGTCTVSRSTDGGVTWKKARLEGVAQYLEELVFDPRSANVLYVLTQDYEVISGIYRSTDDGRSWENIAGELAEAGIARIVIDSAPGGALYAVTQNGLFKRVEPGVISGGDGRPAATALKQIGGGSEDPNGFPHKDQQQRDVCESRTRPCAILGLATLLATCGSTEMTTTAPAVTTTQAAETTATAGREVQRITGVTYIIREDDGLVPAYVVHAPIDIYAPIEESDSWPVVVMLHGAGIGIETLSTWAVKTAQRGAVVFVPEWARSDEISGYSPEELRTILSGQKGDVAAAIRFARATAPQYGGDPTNLTLFGHSAGANEAVVEALSGISPSEGALAGAGSTVPESLVLFDPDYLLGDPTWDPILASDPDAMGLMALATPWQHLGQRVTFPIVVMDSADPSLSREVGDPWAKDSWLALRDPSGDIRRGLQDLGALSGGRYTNGGVAPLLVERLKADGDTVTYVPLTDSTHEDLGPLGMESLLEALVPDAKN